ncbi:RidA family protein [Chloroflexi bacterium TSY]|nr:RidA family protein [Chloroflexi bacterium TSY]
MKRLVVHTDHAPAAVGPYSQAITTDMFVFASGQIGLDPETGELQEGLEKQTEQVLSNIKSVLQASDSAMDKVVKTTIFLTDITHFATVNTIYAKAFGSEPPARSTVAVAALPLGALVEIEVVALINPTEVE